MRKLLVNLLVNLFKPKVASKTLAVRKDTGCLFGCWNTETGEFLEGYMDGSKMKYRRPRYNSKREQQLKPIKEPYLLEYETSIHRSTEQSQNQE